MTAAADIITEAFREGNLIPVGTTPTSAEQAEGLSVLNRYLRSIFNWMMGGALTDWPVPLIQRTGSVAADPPLLPGAQTPLIVPDRSYPPGGQRIVWDGSTQTVYFPESPNDGARMGLAKGSGASAIAGTLTLDGNGRTIEGSATKTFTDTATGSWLYRADLADWVALASLTLTDALPFPDEFDDLFVTSIALRLSPRYGKTVQAGTTEAWKRTLSTFRAQYYQETPAPRGGQELAPSYQSFPDPFGFGITDPLL